MAVITIYGLIHPKYSHLWIQFLHHVTEEVIKLFVLNVAIICQIKNILKIKWKESDSPPKKILNFPINKVLSYLKNTE